MVMCINGCCEMTAEIYEGIEIDVCAECGGVWLDFGELPEIVETQEITWPERVIEQVMSTTGGMGVPIEERQRELYCSKCSTPLKPVNYQATSGIVIDICENDHGVWLDKGELDKIQIYMEKWQTIARDNRSQYQSMLNDLQQDHDAKQAEAALSGPSRFRSINSFLNVLMRLGD